MGVVIMDIDVTTTKTKIGNTLFIVHAEFSETATETAEQKLKRIINNHIAELNNDNNNKNMRILNRRNKPLKGLENPYFST
jgi:hypothetical protein